jgi:hypothetical protein
VDGVRLILGNTCILDRLDSRTLTHDSTDLLTCCVWMEDPDKLPRSLKFTVFVARAGQATPPTGRASDKVILIHMAGYEDWRPHSSSMTSSDYSSSAPPFVPCFWTPGVLDGQPAFRSRVLDEDLACVCTRPSPSYRQALLDNIEATNRGCHPSHSPARSGRRRDYIPHTLEDWERCCSRSLVRQGRTWDADRELRALPLSSNPLIDLCRGADEPVP